MLAFGLATGARAGLRAANERSTPMGALKSSAPSLTELGAVLREFDLGQP
jgi:hypothetical protein